MHPPTAIDVNVIERQNPNNKDANNFIIILPYTLAQPLRVTIRLRILGFREYPEDLNIKLIKLTCQT